ncbi:nitrilase-related carbon-nitrogen hydrolase [Microbacterium soli]|uniref:Carbon-nitrogen hydrolase n=1 Tax=Microbacterium soli TaxID=446075 RepID=A0ABP7N592_9MICO
MVRIAIAQVDCQLGDVEANLETARSQVLSARDRGAELVVFPELSLHGYALATLDEDRSLRADDPRLTVLGDHGPDVLVGFHEDGAIRRYNSAAYVSEGEVLHVQRKLYLPNYLVWEEKKHSSAGQDLRAFDARVGRVATLICNDAWQPVVPWLAAQDGAEIMLIIADSASGYGPESLDNIHYWTELLRFHAMMNQSWVVFCNRVGTERGARFWGGSRVIDPLGQVVAEAQLWEPELLVCDIDVDKARHRRHEVPLVAEARLDFVRREVTRLIADGGDA